VGPAPEASPAVAPAASSSPASSPVGATAADAPRGHESVHALSVVAQPYWRDHSFYEQPEGWPCIEDTFPLVPMTAIIELLAAEAEALAPGQVVVSIEAVRAFKWLAVEPPVAVTVRAVLDGDAEGHEGGTTVARSSIDRHARAQVRLAAAYPPAPAPASRPVTGEIPLPVSVERLYAERHLFHGPEYQGIRSFTAFGTDGVAGRLESQPAPGALLDNAGQLFGFWMASAVDRDRLVLPTSIDRISFFGPHPSPGTSVDCVVNLTSLTDQAVRADLELTVDGQVWCRIEGWEDRRFQSDDRLFLLLRKPQHLLLAEPQPGGWVLVREGWPDSASRDVVMRRFLGQAERTEYAGRNPNGQRTWLLGRIAAKDAVRRLLWDRGAGPIFPIEVHVANEASGRPRADGPTDDDVRISIAHTAGYGVAMAAVGVDVGIDIEVIAPRSDTFEALTLTDGERTLLGDARGTDRDVALTRWWAAKEAASKAAGTGLQGRPRDWEIIEVDGSRVRIGDRWIATETIPSPAGDGETEQLVVAFTQLAPEPQEQD
ncbi:MAG: Modular polyketide synthase, partial [Acidimicrobiales bacterium]|nr:Modular polyketide synthase [Acidimicrobiales bacterium]